VVERDTPGLTVGKIERKLGQRGSKTSEMYLDGVRVPVGNVLGEVDKGFLLAMKDFDMSRPAIGAQALGIAEGAFEQMVKHAKERKTFGQPLCEHQMIQQIIADSATRIEAARGLIYRAAAQFDNGQRNTKLASMGKLFASDAAMQITDRRHPGLRRLRLHAGLPGGADVPRCQADPDLRRRQPDPAAGHRQGKY